MTARRPLIAGNWKMNLNHLEAIAHVQKLAFGLSDADFDAVDVAVLVPYVDLRSVQTLVDGDRLRLFYGAQDVSSHPAGAYTGEVSAAMLQRIGCTFVAIGHSERRQHHNEDDALVGAKIKQALAHELTPIVCIGEGLEVRKAREHVAFTVAQLKGALAGLAPDQVAKLVFAYEPVWAIGTGETATSKDAQEVCAAIRAALTEVSDSVAAGARILYGGSVKATNIAELMLQPDIDGALVGGASLDPDEFVTLAKYRLHPASLVGA
jgi:triosephosphate isomerase (TIM)